VTQPHEPVSWLRLERYALGELTPRERSEIEARLAESPADRDCLAQIVSDPSELPELPARPRSARGGTRRRGLAWGAVALAASLLLSLLRSEPHGGERASNISKGGDVAMLLQSEHGRRQPTTFAQGERFKLLVTCPPGSGRPLSVVVFQGGQRAEPLGGTRELACGNLVPWPGAFVLDGEEPATVCVTWASSRSAATSARELGSEAVCETLTPR
jgi:hypothetical protein